MAGANTHVPDPLSRQDLPMGRGSHPARHGGAWTWAAWARGPWGPVSAGPAVPTSRLGAKPTAPPGPRPAKGRLQDTPAEPQGCCLFPVGWPGGWLCLGAVPRGQRLCAWCHQVASLSVGEGHVRAGPPQVWFHSKGQPPQNDPCCPFLLFWDQQLGLCPRAPLGQTLLGRWEGPAWDHEHRWGSSLPHPHPPPLDNSKTKEGPVFRGNSGSPPQRASASPRSCGRCSGCPPRTRRAVGGGWARRACWVLLHTHGATLLDAHRLLCAGRAGTKRFPLLSRTRLGFHPRCLSKVKERSPLVSTWDTAVKMGTGPQLERVRAAGVAGPGAHRQGLSGAMQLSVGNCCKSALVKGVRLCAPALPNYSCQAACWGGALADL